MVVAAVRIETLQLQAEDAMRVGATPIEAIVRRSPSPWSAPLGAPYFDSAILEPYSPLERAALLLLPPFAFSPKS